MTVPAYPGRLATERRTPIRPNPTPPALAAHDERIAVRARARSDDSRREAHRGPAPSTSPTAPSSS